jgi:hypothetical protein
MKIQEYIDMMLSKETLIKEWESRLEGIDLEKNVESGNIFSDNEISTIENAYNEIMKHLENLEEDED